MALVIRTYRPYTPPAPIPMAPVFVSRPSAETKTGRGGRPRGYYQPNPLRFDDLLSIELAINPDLTRDLFMGPSRLAWIVEARRRVAMGLFHKHNWSGAQIARVMGRDTSTIYNILGTRRSSKYAKGGDL